MKPNQLRSVKRCHILGLIFPFLLAACSGMPDQAQSESQQQQNTQHNKPSEPIKVTTSKGTAELEPLVVSYEEKQDFEDPLEWFNRPVFEFNDMAYRYVLVPVSKGYLDYTPDLFRDGVSNFFNNIDEPLNAINYAIQLEGGLSGKSLARFFINSTIGILGLFDPATSWFDIEYKDTNLNNTLANYQVGHGAFLVLPLLGQTDVRNGFSTLTEGFASPINLATSNPDSLYIQAYAKFHEIAPTAVNYPELRSQSDDHYTFFRNLYLQSVLRDQAFKFPDKEKPESKKPIKTNSAKPNNENKKGVNNE